MIYGYARVSTDGQTLDAQREALASAGAEKVFAETASGAQTARVQLAKVLAILQEGDTLLVTRLDRLARSTRDPLNILAAVTEKKATFRSLADAWADTTTPQGRLMVTVLGGLAEFERELIRARTGEGRTRAKARGQSLGRRPTLTPHQQDEARRRKLEGETVREIARSYNVSASTISRLVCYHTTTLSHYNSIALHDKGQKAKGRRPRAGKDAVSRDSPTAAAAALFPCPCYPNPRREAGPPGRTSI